MRDLYKIPVLEVDKILLEEDEDGFTFYDDGINFKSGGAWQTVQTNAMKSTNCIPLASCNAWLRVTFMSGSSGSLGYGYIPVLKNPLVSGTADNK